MPGRRELTQTDPTHVLPIVHNSYIERGFYAEQLERWFDLFDRDRFLILASAELSDDPAGAMATITAFLGVPEWPSEEVRAALGRHVRADGRGDPRIPGTTLRAAQPQAGRAAGSSISNGRDRPPLVRPPASSLGRPLEHRAHHSPLTGEQPARRVASAGSWTWKATAERPLA
jgi:hypothetical protein